MVLVEMLDRALTLQMILAAEIEQHEQSAAPELVDTQS